MYTKIWISTSYVQLLWCCLYRYNKIWISTSYEQLLSWCLHIPRFENLLAVNSCCVVNIILFTKIWKSTSGEQPLCCLFIPRSENLQAINSCWVVVYVPISEYLQDVISCRVVFIYNKIWISTGCDERLSSCCLHIPRSEYLLAVISWSTIYSH